MNLAPYVEELRHQLLVSAEAGGEEARDLAERVIASLESAIRLVLLDALSAAANEITRDLAPGSVDVRLRGRDPEFVVTSPPINPFLEDVADSSSEIAPIGNRGPGGDGDEGSASRITLRLPEQLKIRIEDAAGGAGLSVNAWLVRAVADAVDLHGRDRRSGRRCAPGGQRFTGWVR